MISKLTPKSIDDIRKHLQLNLKYLNLEGFDISLHKNSTYSNEQVTFKLEVLIAGAKSKDVRDLEQYANMYDLDLNRKHHKWELVGFNSKARAYPFIVRNLEDNKEYKFKIEGAQKYFGKIKESVYICQKLNHT